MAQLIAVTVVQDLNGNPPIGGNQTQQIAVKQIFRVMSSTAVSGAVTRITLMYNTNNALRSGDIYVTETAAAITTAAG